MKIDSKAKALMFLEAMLNSAGSQSKMRLVPHTKENLKIAKQIAGVIFDAEPSNINVRYRKGERSNTFTKDVKKNGSKAFDLYVSSSREEQRLKDELYKGRESIGSMSFDMNVLRNENLALQKELEEATLKVANVKELNNRLNNSLDNQDAEIEVLKKKIADLQESHSEADRYAMKWRSNKEIYKALLEEKIADVDNFG